ncbi:MAG: HTH-type transcriptional regulator BhcR [Geminicoccaceae bacterium]
MLDNVGAKPRRARGRPRGWTDNTAQNTVKSLDRALQVFAYLSQVQGKPLTALAAETGQSPATVYRVLVTLEGRGLVEFDPESQVWYIGPQAFVIGARYLRRTSLVERARPILRTLMEETGETANLGIEKGGMVLFVSQVETHENIRAFFPPGTLSPMHASGIGKALLAQMDPARFERWHAAHPLHRFTAHTLVTRDALLASLDETRARGFAVDAEEKSLGMRCIAAPVFDMNREAIAGISVSGPTSRLGPATTAAFSAAAIRAARDLSKAMGGEATPSVP